MALRRTSQLPWEPVLKGAGAGVVTEARLRLVTRTLSEPAATLVERAQLTRLNYGAPRSEHLRALMGFLATVIIVALIYMLANAVLAPRFRALEHAEIETSLERVEAALHAHNNELRRMATEYAQWDATYAFAASPDAAYIAENFGAASLAEMNVDRVWMFDLEGALIYSKSRWGRAVRGPTMSRQMLSDVRASWALVQPIVDARDGVHLLRLGGQPYLLAVNEIVRSNRSGPAIGIQVYARRIKQSDIAALKLLSLVPTLLRPVSEAQDPRLDTDIDRWQRGAASQTTRITDFGERLVGLRVVRSLGGAPALIIGTHTTGELILYGKRTAQQLIALMSLLVAGAGAFFGLLGARLAKSRRATMLTQARYEAIVAHAEEAILVIDPVTRIVHEANPAFERLAGLRAAEVCGRDVDAFFDRRGGAVSFEEARQASLSNRALHGLRLIRESGESVDVELSASTLPGDAGAMSCVILRDVSARKEAERRLLEQQSRLEFVAHHDALTGLPNRAYLNANLSRWCDEAARDDRALALMCVDLDHFKRVNDTGGHHLGDELLRQVASRLRAAIVAPDRVIRMGGDEFVLVAVRGSDAEFEARAQRIVDALRNPFTVDGRTFRVTASVGIAVYPRDATSGVELLQCADLAAYAAKSAGRDGAQFFTPNIHVRSRERLALEQALRRAVAAQEIEVHMQPIVDLRSSRVAGLEALARWHHPEFGDIPPSRFIPIAEETDLIVELGSCVLRKVARGLGEWGRAELPLVPVSINVSARQFERIDLKRAIVEAAGEAGVDASLFQIELTESLVMKQEQVQIAALQALRASGIRVAIDDFGTGYSSLSYLKHLPIDHLKIDRSFVRDMVSDANDEAIVGAIISMARSLSLDTVAEGVETVEQVSKLLALGCHLGQGYHFSRPVPIADCAPLLASLRERPTSMADTTTLRVIAGRRPA